MSLAKQKIKQAVQEIENKVEGSHIKFLNVSEEGHWLFVNYDLSFPEFSKDTIDVNILHEMVDEIYNEFGLPYTFLIGQYE